MAFAGLLLVAITWGTTFPISKTLFGRVGVWDLLAVRFSIAAGAMLVCWLPAVRRLPRRLLRHGAGLGVVYGAAQIVANLGLERAPAAVAGFITGTYVVLTPLCAALILRARIGARAWVAAAVAALGLGTLALHGFSVGVGETLALLSALLYALHIVALGMISTVRDAVGLAVVQIVATAAVSVVAALVVQGRINLPGRGTDWAVIAYMALVSGALAMMMQSWAQAHLPATRVALVMATEPLWAAALSVMFLHEAVTARLVIGATAIVSALIIAETGASDGRRPGRASRRRVRRAGRRQR
ncbi:Threonine/homoserine efflux transporter RhtA [Nakamurella panacisegetis]|uniref:Threonine/homoserine efflux transporter RhtA n=2 Tax=Nakamurella panacisegetis TaxID=1090615 RepID=A0A1H0T770_9ACTN|nr:Threonine/homoserine efflux transporter RhtA [Nakamurella panacisegetis]